MKHIVALLALTATLYAAPPVVEVVSLSAVKIDGFDIGNVAKAISDRPDAAAAIMAQLKAREDALNAASKAREDALNAKLAAAAARRAELIALAKTKLATLSPEAKAVVVGVITAAELPEKELLKAKLMAELAAKQKELDDASK